MRKSTSSTVLLTALFTIVATTSNAQETTVQNDSFVSGGPAVVFGDFVPGEEGGVRLESPCDGAIVAVQIGWLADGGSAVPTVERAIFIYEDGIFPTPGALLETIPSPLLTPGNLNEFRFLDAAESQPLNVPVSNGEHFYITLQFDNATDVGAGSASLFRDTDGCTANANVLNEATIGWFDFCFFLAGDVVMRAVVECGETACPADLNVDSEVSVADLLLLLADWGTPGADITGDGDTTVGDLLDLLAAWGPCP